MKIYWSSLKTVTLPLTLLVFSAVAQGQRALPVESVRTREIERMLRQFEENPSEVLEQDLPKRDANGNIVEEDSLFFDTEHVNSREFITNKDEYRRQLNLIKEGTVIRLDQIVPGRAAYLYNDRAENLVDNPNSMLQSLEAMEDAQLMTGKLEENPWSDSYWPIYQGQTAARYADYDFLNSSRADWRQFFNYVMDPTRSLDSLFTNLSAGIETDIEIDTLSPAEKYDLLVGDANGTMTKKMWAQGERYYNNYGEVETWMGLCHGWATASFMEKRPTAAAYALAADGETTIKFYPSDIKALATQLWANMRHPSRFIGGRCNDKNPIKDENGRVQDPSCFDTNPGTWHLAVVNQIGVSKRSFVMDATFDYQVWNHPVVAYEYSYFNPSTLKEEETVSEAKIAMGDYINDKLSQYRAENATHVVGVVMDVLYLVETHPTHRNYDTEDYDALRSVRYFYDLELDANGTIIGGEWRTNKHPDFLWVHPKNDQPLTGYDRFAEGEWDPAEGLPASWQNAGQRSSQSQLPLAKIVRGLIEESRR